MIIKKSEIDINEAIKFADYEKLLLKRKENNMLLSDFQINVLSRNGINYLNHSNMHDLLFEIEECLNDEYDDELDMVSSQISEYLYYKDTKKWEKLYFLNVVEKIWESLYNDINK